MTSSSSLTVWHLAAVLVLVQELLDSAGIVRVNGPQVLNLGERKTQRRSLLQTSVVWKSTCCRWKVSAHILPGPEAKPTKRHSSQSTQAAQAHHSFLDEELRPLQGAGHVVAQPLALVLLQHLAVEGANLQHKQNRFQSPSELLGSFRLVAPPWVHMGGKHFDRTSREGPGPYWSIRTT